MKFKLTTTIPTSPERVYQAWLSSKQHTSMTDGEAKCTKRRGGTFTAWDGYIHGKNLELRPNEYIKQSWRTVEFEEDQPDSVIEIILEAKGADQCKLTLLHSDLSSKDKKYKQGWVDSYFDPMKSYFKSTGK